MFIENCWQRDDAQAMREGESATPETEEYGIGSFVYRARRPFHPGRLHSFFTSYFTLQQPQPDLDESDSERGMHGMHLSGLISKFCSFFVRAFRLESMCKYSFLPFFLPSGSVNEELSRKSSLWDFPIDSLFEKFSHLVLSA